MRSGCRNKAFFQSEREKVGERVASSCTGVQLLTLLLGRAESVGGGDEM